MLPLTENELFVWNAKAFCPPNREIRSRGPIATFRQLAET
jgi:hypothetical protein